ncbi:MAG: hypothetical protein IBX61_04765 [Thermoleophilia bacterium]|nr:hypothetical protein [Thermoleophilia bacterium]
MKQKLQAIPDQSLMVPQRLQKPRIWWKTLNVLGGKKHTFLAYLPGLICYSGNQLIRGIA